MEHEISQKLKILADAAKFDASCASSGSKRATPKGGIGNAEGMGICHSYTPDGRCVSLLKILMTNICLDRSKIYLTNAVKHFKHEVTNSPSGGKLRLHKTPNSGDVSTCKGWLDAELSRIKPKFVICLGVTAAQVTLGRAVSIGSVRGQWLRSRWSEHTLVTAHPASILRSGEHLREEAFIKLVTDLKMVRAMDATYIEKTLNR